MFSANSALRGVVHGNRIEVSQDLGLPDGQEVTLTLQLAEPETRKPGDGLLASFGGWADDPSGLDEFLESNRHQRRASRRDIEP
jgi:hypothetical protein